MVALLVGLEDDDPGGLFFPVGDEDGEAGVAVDEDAIGEGFDGLAVVSGALALCLAEAGEGWESGEEKEE